MGLVGLSCLLSWQLSETAPQLVQDLLASFGPRSFWGPPFLLLQQLPMILPEAQCKDSCMPLVLPEAQRKDSCSFCGSPCPLGASSSGVFLGGRPELGH
mgnify:FL=1